MKGKKIRLCLLRLRLFMMVAVMAGVLVPPAWAQSVLTIESPRHGSTTTSSTLSRPWGQANSSSRVREVKVLLQRANDGAWLSWDGNEWSNALKSQAADFNVATGVWAWPQSVALPQSTLMPTGNYRLQVASIASNESVLGRATSAFVVKLGAMSRAVPSNDTPKGAKVISGAMGRILGTTVDAAAHNPDNSGDGGFADVWYNWTAPSGVSQASFSATNGAFLFAYRIEPDNKFTQVGSDSGSSMTFVATPGRQYLIEVGARFGNPSPFTLSWAAGVVPPNDTPARATAISGVAGRVEGQNIGASGHSESGSDEGGYQPDVWWKWRSPGGAPSNVVFNASGSSFRASINIYTVDSTGQLQFFQQSDGVPSITFQAQPNTLYFIEVFSAESARGTISLTWSVNGAPLPATTGTVRGRLTLGQTGLRATVFLVPGTVIDPFFFSEALGLRRVASAADGTYSFTNVPIGQYVVVPSSPRLAFGPTSLRANVQAGVTSTANFSVAIPAPDPVGPTVTVGGMTRSNLNGAYVPSSISGTAADTFSPLTPITTGLFRVGYVVYRLNADAASLRLPPGQRRPNAIYSKRTRSFVSNTGTLPVSTDSAFFTQFTANSGWSSVFDVGLRTALASPGTYRVAVFALDNAFNTISHSSTSTDPDRPANGIFVFAHFETSVANIAVTRTLPLSTPNGGTITYAISVSNTGDLPLRNVAARQTINTDKTVLIDGSITPTPSAREGRDIIWSLGTIPPHETRLLRLSVKASDNNPFGSNIAAGALSVTSSDRNYFFGRDQINIESSTWLIGGALNAIRAIGDAIGSAFNFVFGTATRDRLAQADLNTVRGTSVLTRLAGADALRFGNGATIVAVGAGNIVAVGAGNIVSPGGGNIVAVGAGNIVAVGAGNAISVSGLTASNILSQLVTNPSNVLAHNAAIGSAFKGANLVLLSGNNIVAVGAGNIVSPGGGNIVAAGAGNFKDNFSGLLPGNRVQLNGTDSARLVGNNGNTLSGLNGAGLVGNNGNTFKLAGGRGNTLIGADGASLIGADGASLIGADGAS